MQPTFPQVLECISGGKDGPPIMIFTIGYGDDADAETLKQIPRSRAVSIQRERFRIFARFSPRSPSISKSSPRKEF